MSRYYFLVFVSAVLVGCEPAPASEPTEARSNITTAMRDALERFRTTVQGTPPDTLTGGASSRDELMRRFADAVQRADTTALIAMTMNRAEFAYLYYPHTIYTRPPYQQDAETAWLLSKMNSEKGLTRILQRFGAKPFEVAGLDCAADPKQEGPNRYWPGCTLTTHVDGAPPSMRWFGSIWERDARFKFVSYANDF
jgi:hypothetical protein